MRVGVDIGGVVIGGPGNDTQFFTGDWLHTPAVKGAWTALWNFWNLGVEVYFISKAGKRTASKTCGWLIYHYASNIDGSGKTVFPLNNLVFCKKREQKAPIARMLELDVFIDDRQDICDSMEAAGIRPILFKDWKTTLGAL